MVDSVESRFNQLFKIKQERDQCDGVVHAESDAQEKSTLEGLFKQAVREVPGRAVASDDIAVFDAVYEGDPYEKRTLSKSHEDALCTHCLHGRVWDLMLEKIFDADGPEKSQIIKEMLDTFHSNLCTTGDVDTYYADLKANRPTKSQGGKKGEVANAGGALNDVVVIYQHIPRPLCFILCNNEHFK